MGPPAGASPDPERAGSGWNPGSPPERAPFGGMELSAHPLRSSSSLTVASDGSSAGPPGSGVSDDAQDEGARSMVGGIEDSRELVVAQLLGSLHDDEQRFHARPGALDHPANLGRLSSQRFRRRYRQHDLSCGGRLEVSLGVSRAGLNDHGAACGALERPLAQLSFDRAAARNLDDQLWFVGHRLGTLASLPVPLRKRVAWDPRTGCTS